MRGDAVLGVIGEIDTLVVGSFEEPSVARRDRRLIAWLRRTAPRARRVVSLCSGVFLLAEAGLLDGRRATTHWTFCAELARRYPRVTLDPEPIYVHDRGVYTSAGAAASIDLLLGLVEEDFGRRVAQSVALHMVLFLKRPSGQAQMSVPLSAGLAERGVLRDLQSWIVDHLGEDLGVPALARRVAMSPRNFFRAFSHETGVTPARFVERARVEGARQLLEDTRAGVEVLLTYAGAMPTPLSAIAFQQLHGAAARVAPDATAFPHRYDHHACYVHPATDDPAESEKIVRWGRDCWEALQPFVEPAVYVNALEDALEDGAHRVREAYGPNYARLAAAQEGVRSDEHAVEQSEHPHLNASYAFVAPWAVDPLR